MVESRLNKPLAIAAIVVALVLGVLLGITSGVADRIFGGPDPKTIATSSLESMRAQNRLITFVARYVSVVSSEQERLGGLVSTERTLILPGNVRYEVDLSKSGGGWRGTAVLTDRPPEPPRSGDPAQGGGKTASTDQVETQIEQRLLKLVRIEGRAECPAEIRIRRGNDFTCKVVGAGRPVTVEVTQKDDRGNLGYRISTDTP